MLYGYFILLFPAPVKIKTSHGLQKNFHSSLPIKSLKMPPYFPEYTCFRICAKISLAGIISYPESISSLAAWALLIFVLSFCFQLLAQAGEAHEKKTAFRMAYHDSLTGFLKHAGIFHAAEKMDRRKPYILLFMDLNGLKEVNDLHGHIAGDMFLKHMADTLRSSTGENALCGRVGGDEFIVILPSETEASLSPVIREINGKLAELKGQPGMPKDPSASFGWSIHDTSHALTFEEHLKEADDRMYKAKEAYRKSHPSAAGRVFMREK